MHQKHVKIGETYNQKIGNGHVKVLVKSRRITPKSGIVAFETIDPENTAGEPEFVSAKHLSPLPAAS